MLYMQNDCSDSLTFLMNKLPINLTTLTDNEWWSAVAWCLLGFGVWREDNVNDPETRGVMKPQQKYSQQHRAEVSGGAHVCFRQLWCRTVRCLGLCAAGGGGRGRPGTNQLKRSDITCGLL